MGTYAILADADLVVRAKAGDRNAFAVLYDRHFAPLHDFLTRMTRNRDEAAELVQDTFLVAMQRLESLQQPPRFKSWLFQIAYRRTLDRLEKSKRWQLTSPTPGNDGETNALLVQVATDRLNDPEDAAAANEAAALVWEAARSLDERTFAILDLHVRQGLSSAEIAEVLDVKPNHAYVLVNRMKERVEGAIGTLLLVRKGRRDCQSLQATISGLELPPVTEQVRKRVERHVKECETCQQRRRGLVAPLRAYGALAAVPARTGVKDEIWRTLDLAWPTGRSPSVLDRWRHTAAILGAVGLVAVLPFLLVLALAGDGPATGSLVTGLTASPVDRTPEAAQSLGVGNGLLLPPPPPYEPPPPPSTATPTASAVPTEAFTGLPPIVTIQQPTSGTIVATRQDATGPYALVTLRGSADDVDSAPESLGWAWSSNAEGALAASDVVTGVKLHIFGRDSQCSGPLGLIGDASTDHRITLAVTDDTAGVGSQSVDVTVEVECNAELPSDPPVDPSPSPTPSESESPEPTFTVSCTPSSHSVSPGPTAPGQNTSDCTATADAGFSGPIEWSCEVPGDPSGIDCGMAPDRGALPDGGTATSRLTIHTSSPPSGTWEVTVVAVVNGVTRLATVTITVA